MRPFLASLVAFFTVLSLGFVATPNAEPTEKRIALVIGNAAYRTRPLPTSAKCSVATRRGTGLCATPSRR